jgi:hypothetical protein
MDTAADQVMDLIFGRWRSQILAAGTELGVFDRLDKRKAKTAQTLAAEVDADPTLLYRLLRAQAAIGLLEEDGARGSSPIAEPHGAAGGGPTALCAVEASPGHGPRRQAECVHA